MRMVLPVLYPGLIYTIFLGSSSSAKTYDFILPEDEASFELSCADINLVDILICFDLDSYL